MTNEQKAFAIINAGKPVSVNLHGIVLNGVAVHEVEVTGLGLVVTGARAVVPWGDRVMLIEWKRGETVDSAAPLQFWDEASAVAIKLRRRLHPKGVKP
jgi:hypothetical protein